MRLYYFDITDLLLWPGNLLLHLWFFFFTLVEGSKGGGLASR